MFYEYLVIHRRSALVFAIMDMRSTILLGLAQFARSIHRYYGYYGVLHLSIDGTG